MSYFRLKYVFIFINKNKSIISAIFFAILLLASNGWCEKYERKVLFGINYDFVERGSFAVARNDCIYIMAERQKKIVVLNANGELEKEIKLDNIDPLFTYRIFIDEDENILIFGEFESFVFDEINNKWITIGENRDLYHPWFSEGTLYNEENGDVIYRLNMNASINQKVFIKDFIIKRLDTWGNKQYYYKNKYFGPKEKDGYRPDSILYLDNNGNAYVRYIKNIDEENGVKIFPVKTVRRLYKISTNKMKVVAQFDFDLNYDCYINKDTEDIYRIERADDTTSVLVVYRKKK